MSYLLKSQAVYDLVDIDLYKVPYLRIPHSWYTNIQKNDKPYLHAITLLSDVVSFYMPVIERNEDGTVGTVQQRFAGEFLQRSYKQIQQQYGLTRKQARPAYQHLEEMGLLKVIFDTTQTNKGKILANVMYIQLFPQTVLRITLDSIDLNGWMAAAIKPPHDPRHDPSQNPPNNPPNNPPYPNGHTDEKPSLPNGHDPSYPNGNDGGKKPSSPNGHDGKIPLYPNGHTGLDEPSYPNGHVGVEAVLPERRDDLMPPEATGVTKRARPSLPNGHDPSCPFGYDPSLPNGHDHCTNILDTKTLDTKTQRTAAAAAQQTFVSEDPHALESSPRARRGAENFGENAFGQNTFSENVPIGSALAGNSSNEKVDEPPFDDPIWWNLANQWVSRAAVEQLCREYMDLDDWRDQVDIIEASDTGRLLNLLLWLHYAHWNGVNMLENGIQNLPGYIRSRLHERPSHYSRRDIDELMVKIQERTEGSETQRQGHNGQIYAAQGHGENEAGETQPNHKATDTSPGDEFPY